MSPTPDLPIGSQPADVPSFGCIVYVARRDGGGVRVRVANLPGIVVDASDERSALAKVVPAFKKAVREFVQSGEPIPWVDPPDAITENEQKRFLPVHL